MAENAYSSLFDPCSQSPLWVYQSTKVFMLKCISKKIFIKTYLMGSSRRKGRENGNEWNSALLGGCKCSLTLTLTEKVNIEKYNT